MGQYETACDKDVNKYLVEDAKIDKAKTEFTFCLELTGSCDIKYPTETSGDFISKNFSQSWIIAFDSNGTSE